MITLNIISENMVSNINIIKPTIAISITEPFLEHPEYPKSDLLLDVLKLHFDDVDQSIGCYSFRREIVLMNSDHVNSILDFVDKYKNQVSTIICQCQAGISRSSATAAALSILLNGERSDQWIFNSFQYYPNQYVYHSILKVAKERILNGSLSWNN